MTVDEKALAVDRGSGRLVHAHDSAGGQILALVHIPANSRSAFFLYDNPELLPFSTFDRKPSGPIISLRWRTMAGDRVAFFEPAFESYLVTLPDVANEKAGRLSLIAPGVERGNCFKLTEALDGSLTPSVRHQIELADRVAACYPTTILGAPRTI